MIRATPGTARRTKKQAKARPDVLAPFFDEPPSSKRPPFTQIPDWVMLSDRVGTTAFRLWCILRSMQFENGPGIPPLTMDEICWLLPGVNGKPTSRSRAKEAMDNLLDVGLLKDVSAQGLSRTTPRLYLAMDEPSGPMGHSSARRKLKRYTKLWRKAFD